MTERNEITFEIVEHIGVLQERANGMRRELNRVAWNGGTPKFDIRDWNSDHTRMTKGLTLSAAELNTIRSLMDERDNRADFSPRESYGMFDRDER